MLEDESSPSKKALLRVLRGETLAVPPIWLKRQAGRYLPEYRALRETVGGFLDLFLKYGSWNEEVVHIAATQDSRWQYRQLTPKEQEKVVERYLLDSHEKIDYPHAWIERSAHEGMAEYSVIFTDDDGCIQFRLNVTGLAIR